MKCTIINPYRGQICYARISLDEVYNLIKDGSLRPDPRIAPNKQICFSAEWRRSNGQTHLISNNHLALLQLRNLFDLATAEEYKRQASLLPYTLLAFIGSSDTAFVPLYDILERLRKEFPTFAINRSTDSSEGRCLHALGYEHKKTCKGIFYKIKAIQP